MPHVTERSVLAVLAVVAVVALSCVAQAWSHVMVPPQTSACPSGMVHVTSEDTSVDVCVDVYEGGIETADGRWPFNKPVDNLPVGSYKAVQEAGAKPQAYISADQATAACNAVGKRLCSLDEWMLACKGRQGYTYPYGNTYDAAACNENRTLNPVNQLFGPHAAFNWTELNDPAIDLLANTLAASGAFPKCVSPFGAYDMAGNVEEWVSTTTHRGTGIFKGGYFMHVTVNGLGCDMITTAHAQWYHDYSLSFRCCASPAHAVSAAPTATQQPRTVVTEEETRQVVVDSSKEGADSTVPSCDSGMTAVPSSLAPSGYVCMDRFEAPNRLGHTPLVMYDVYEAEAWCSARQKRLCYMDEWESACEGPNRYQYPYGNTRVPGKCNDNHGWRLYNQTILNYWQNNISTPEIESFGDLMTKVLDSKIEGAEELVTHLSWLYQGNVAGEDTTNCTSAYGAVDTIGNVEEWTLRRKPGGPLFHACLKGRYWADTRTCQDIILTHGDLFRFYEIGFRCCKNATVAAMA